jgi:hypothetical protein
VPSEPKATASFTRRRFLGALGATCLALANAGGCELLGHASKLRSLRAPKASPLRAPRVLPLPSVAPVLPKGVWSFRSRPDLAPAEAEVTRSAYGTAPGYVFLAMKEGAGEHGPMILDDRGQLVWYARYIAARAFKVQRYRSRPVLTWWEGTVVAGHGVGEYVVFDDSYHVGGHLRPAPEAVGTFGIRPPDRFRDGDGGAKLPLVLRRAGQRAFRWGTRHQRASEAFSPSGGAHLRGVGAPSRGRDRASTLYSPKRVEARFPEVSRRYYCTYAPPRGFT